MKKNILGKILTVLGILLLQSSSIYAGFGVSPTNIYSEILKPGAHFEKTITLSRSDTSEDLLITVEPALGEMESWFQFDPATQFTFPQGESRKTFRVIVNVPETAEYKDFNGVIRVKASDIDKNVKGVSVVEGARLDVDLVTTQDDVTDLLIRSMKMLESVDGEPLRMEIVAENTGNVAVSPDAEVVIKNLQMEELETLEDNDLESIEPNETKTVYGEFHSTLPEGEYFVEATVFLGNTVLREDRLAFTIVGQREAEEEERLIASILNFFKEYWVYVVIGLVSLSLVYMLLVKVWSSKRGKIVSEKKMTKFLGAGVLSRVFISLLVSIWLTSVSWFVINKYFSIEDSELASVNVSVEGDDILQVEEGDTVKGSSTVNLDNEEEAQPFVVNSRDENGEVQYPIFEYESVNSDVIYYAKEDEEFSVLRETNDWYMVSINDQTVGWLQKNMVKSSVVVEE